MGTPESPNNWEPHRNSHVLVRTVFSAVGFLILLSGLPAKIAQTDR